MFNPLCLLALLLILLNGCGSLGGKDNSEPPAPLVDFTPTVTVKTVWTAHAGSGTRKGYFKLSPSFHDDQIVTVSPKGHVRVFNINNGKRVWERKINIPISSGPGIGEGIILVGSHKGHVVALSEIDGKELWRTQVSSEILAPPRLSQAVVVVRTVDGHLFGLKSQSGEHLWKYEQSSVPLLSLRGTSTPLVVNDLIIAGFDNGKIAALELHTGKVLWEAPVAVPRGRTELERMVDIDADPLLIGNAIYVTSYQGRTVAIDLFKGKLLWERDIFSYAGLGASANTLYLTDKKSHIWAFDRYSGATLWKQTKLQARGVTAPVNLGEYVVVGDKQGYLHWMQADTGQFVVRHRLGRTNILGSPLVANDLLIAYDNRGEMVALRPE